MPKKKAPPNKAAIQNAAKKASPTAANAKIDPTKDIIISSSSVARKNQRKKQEPVPEDEELKMGEEDAIPEELLREREKFLTITPEGGKSKNNSKEDLHAGGLHNRSNFDTMSSATVEIYTEHINPSFIKRKNKVS